MAFVTYILLSTLLAGLRGAFHPELLGLTATTAFAVVIFEILGLKLGCYILSISNESQLLDLVAYSGYKFVGIIVTLVIAEIVNGGKGTGGWVGWAVFLYCYFADAFFLVSFLYYREIAHLTWHHRSYARSDMFSFQNQGQINLVLPPKQWLALREVGALGSWRVIAMLCSWL